MPKMSTTSENGMIAIVAAAVTIEITGASANSQPLEPAGRNWALKTSLPMSAIACSSAERADAVRAVAVLEAAQDLAVGEQRQRHEVEDDGEDHDRLQDLHPPRLVVADLGEDHQVTSRGGIGRPAEGGISARPSTAGCDLRSGTALGSIGARPDPVISTSGCVSTFALSSRVPSARKTLPAGIASRSLTCARTRVPLPTSTRSPSLMPERGGVGRRELGDLAGADELQRGREVDLLGRPQRAVGAEPQLAVGRRRAAACGHLERGGLPVGRDERLALDPAHAAAADLLEREPGVERDGLEQPRARPARRCGSRRCS